jgi:hypothetical protein
MCARSAGFRWMPQPVPQRLPLRREDGSTLLLTLTYGLMALVLILVAVASTSLYLERKRLLTLADGAALAGAEAFPLGTVVVEAGTVRPVLKPAAVERAVRDYVVAAPNANFDGLAVTQATSVDGQSATVSLSSFWRPPVLTFVLPSGIPLSVTTVARSVFW